MPLRILHTADWHWGAHNAHPIYVSSLIPELVRVAAQNRCKYILSVGDTFDKPRPDQQIKDSFLEHLLSIPDDIRVIFTPGNHDYTTKSLEYHSLQYLNYIRRASHYKINIQLVEPDTYWAFPDFDLYAMKDWGDVALAEKEHRSNKPLILTWHGIVPGLSFSDPDKVPASATEQIEEMLARTGATYIALGDIHRPFRLHRRCSYSGPPVQKTYADKDAVLILEIPFKLKKKRLDLPKRKTIKVDFKEGKHSEQDIVDFVRQKVPPNTLLKLKFETTPSVFSSINKRYIQNLLQYHVSELKMENEAVVDARRRKDMEKVSKAKSMRDEVDIVISQEGYGLDKRKLRETCARYI